MPDYLKIIGNCFPDAEAYIKGSNKSPENYNDITWITTPIDQSVLDASPCASGQQIDVGQDYATYRAGQTLRFYYGKIPFKSGTTQFKSKTSAPLITEGSELWSLQVTPNTVSSLFTISFSVLVDSRSKSEIMVAVFRDSQLVGATVGYCSGNDKPVNMHVQFSDRLSDGNPVTYSARIGLLDSNGTWYINRAKSYDVGQSMQQTFILLENE